MCIRDSLKTEAKKEQKKKKDMAEAIKMILQHHKLRFFRIAFISCLLYTSSFKQKSAPQNIGSWKASSNPPKSSKYDFLNSKHFSESAE